MKTPEKNINIPLSTESSNLKLPINACQTQSIHKKNIQQIEYLSNNLKYKLLRHLKFVCVFKIRVFTSYKTKLAVRD